MAANRWRVSSRMCVRISAWCWSENGASARVLAKAGLRFARRYQDIEPKSGQPADCLEYALRATEWHASQRLSDVR